VSGGGRPEERQRRFCRAFDLGRGPHTRTMPQPEPELGVRPGRCGPVLMGSPILPAVLEAHRAPEPHLDDVPLSSLSPFPRGTHQPIIVAYGWGSVYFLAQLVPAGRLRCHPGRGGYGAGVPRRSGRRAWRWEWRRESGPWISW
jgi:hypothetical protein